MGKAVLSITPGDSTNSAQVITTQEDEFQQFILNSIFLKFCSRSCFSYHIMITKADHS